MKHYIKHKGEIKDLTNYFDEKENQLNVEKLNLKGEIYSEAAYVYCSFNQITNADFPMAIIIFCHDNKLNNYNFPLATFISCDNNPLKAIVKECGDSERQIWSQKLNGTIYTYIGCGRFTLEEAISAINCKYKGQDAIDYIEKVKLSQSLAE